MTETKIVLDSGVEYFIQKDSIELKKYPDVPRHSFGAVGNEELVADTEFSFMLSRDETVRAVEFQMEHSDCYKIIGVDGIAKITSCKVYIDQMGRITIYGLYE